MVHLQIRDKKNCPARTRGKTIVLQQIVVAILYNPRLRQMEIRVFGYDDLPALAIEPVKNAQDFVHVRIWIDADVIIIDACVQATIARQFTQAVRDVQEMPFAAVIRAHDVQAALVPFVGAIGIDFEVNDAVFGKAIFLNVAVPVPDADNKILYTSRSGVAAHNLPRHFKVHDTFAQQSAHLGRNVNSLARNSPLRGDKFPALSKRRACEQ